MTVVASKRKVKVIHKVKKNSSSISESLNFLAKNKWRKNLKRLKNRFQKGIQKKLAQLEQSTSIGTGSSTFAKHLSSLDNLLVEKIDNERKKLDDVSKKLTEVTEFLGVVANMSSSSSPTAPEKKKNKRSIESVEFMDKPWQLDIDSNGTKLPIVYDAATLRTKYNLDSKPKLANQGKKAGQCAFQAYIGLLRSITSIGYGHEFAKEEVVRSRAADFWALLIGILNLPPSYRGKIGWGYFVAAIYEGSHAFAERVIFIDFLCQELRSLYKGIVFFANGNHYFIQVSATYSSYIGYQSWRRSNEIADG